MTDREAAAFWALAALIFPAFAPVDLLGGRIVAAVGFVVCAGVALFLYCRSQGLTRRP